EAGAGRAEAGGPVGVGFRITTIFVVRSQFHDWEASNHLPTEDAYRAAAELRGALRRFLRQSEAVTRRHGLTTQRYELLLAVKTGRDGEERATLGELAERLALAPSSITELVARSAALGLVPRELDPSSRPMAWVAVT